MPFPKIDHKIFELIVPSTKEKLAVRQMLVKEEKILLMGMESDDDDDVYTSIKQILTNCVVSPADFDVDKVAIFDVEYLFLKLRSLSISNVTTVAYVDAEDGETYKFDIDLDAIEVQFPEKVDNVVRVTEDVAFTLSYPTGKLYDDKEFVIREEDPYFLLTCKCINKVYEGEEIFDALEADINDTIEFVDALPTEAYDKCKKFFQNMPIMRHVISYKNQKGTERTIVLSTLKDFFTLR